MTWTDGHNKNGIGLIEPCALWLQCPLFFPLRRYFVTIRSARCAALRESFLNFTDSLLIERIAAHGPQGDQGACDGHRNERQSELCQG